MTVASDTSAANPVAQAASVGADDHVGVLEQVLAVYDPTYRLPPSLDTSEGTGPRGLLTSRLGAPTL